MDERIHDFLDGELPRDALTDAEREQVAVYTLLLDGVVRSVPSAPVPDLAPLVQRRIEGLAIQPNALDWAVWLRRGWHWLWRPLTVRLRPAALLAPVAALALLLVLRPAGTEDGAAMESARVFVQFRLEVPGASSVALAGDFTNWQPMYSLQRARPDIWTVMIPLEPGVHDYAFVVDGERWIPDPYAAQVADGFGGVNSRVSVLVPDRTVRS